MGFIFSSRDGFYRRLSWFASVNLIVIVTYVVEVVFGGMRLMEALKLLHKLLLGR